MKKKLIIFFVILWILILSANYYISRNKDLIIEYFESKVGSINREMPPYGEKEYTRSKYGHVLDKIDYIADSSESAFKFKEKIEKLKLPTEFIYVAIKRAEAHIQIVNRFKWNRSSTITNGEYGAGYLEGDKTINIMIYDRKVDWTYMDSFIVYIEYTEDVNNKSSELEG